MKNIFSFKKMKSFVITLSVLFIFSGLMPQKSYAAYIVGTSNSEDSIWIFNNPAWTVFSAAQLSLTGFTIIGANSVSWNPADGKFYIILRISNGFPPDPRELATVDPETGICTDVGDMGGAFSSMTFSPSGTLYAIGGQGGGTISEKLYSINTSNGTPTFLAGPFSVGADGEVIAYNPADDFIYHWSGNGTANMEKINTVGFTASSIPQSGFLHFEIFGAVYKGGGEFYATDIDNQTLIITSAGVVSLEATDLPSRIRGLGLDNGVLPVELSSFTSAVSGRDVKLNWTTTTETNNARFEIERAASDNVWTKLGFVNGHGTTVIPCSYSFSDKGLNSGTYNYRLKQIDYNGNFEYFNLSNEVNIGVPGKYTLSQNYPNPFNPTTNLEFGISELGFASLKIYDVLGNEVATLVNEKKNPGNYSVTFDGSNLPSGVYFYKMTAGNFSEVKKMTLLK